MDKCENVWIFGETLPTRAHFLHAAPNRPYGPLWPRWADSRITDANPHVTTSFSWISTHFEAYSGSDSRADPFPLRRSGNCADPYGESARFESEIRLNSYASSLPIDLHGIKIHCAAIWPYRGAIWAGRCRHMNRRNRHSETRGVFNMDKNGLTSIGLVEHLHFAYRIFCRLLMGDSAT